MVQGGPRIAQRAVEAVDEGVQRRIGGQARRDDAGAVGGKLLGAGGGGFMLLFVESDKQPAVMEKLKDLIRAIVPGLLLDSRKFVETTTREKSGEGAAK